MRVVFMGTPDFAVPCLEAVVEHFEVVAVVTQPDRKQGRGQKVRFSPVKQKAVELGIPILQPANINKSEVVTTLQSYQPDVLVVVAYGQLLKKKILQLAPGGAINVHASLLPHLRGGAPIHHAILRGYAETGVTTMQIARRLDAGDMYLQTKVAILPDENVGQLHDRLAICGAQLLVKTLNELGTLALQPQDEGLASYAPNLTAADRTIQWERSSHDIYNQIRGLNPWPIAYTYFRGKQLQILRAKQVVSERQTSALPGTIVSVDATGITVQCGQGLLELLEVKPQNKRKMSAGDFQRGYRCQAGESLGLSVQQ